MTRPTRQCTHCQADLSNLEEGITFCPHCGRPLRDPLTESPAATPVPDTPTMAPPPPPQFTPPQSTTILRQVCMNCGNIVECEPGTTLCPICQKPLTAKASTMLLPKGVGILVGKTTRILLLSLAAGLTTTLIVYFILWLLIPPNAWLRNVLFPAGGGQIIPWATLLLLFWGGIWLALRAYFLKQEKQAVTEAFGQNLVERLTRGEAAKVLSELQSLPEEDLGIFWGRVQVALAEWQRSRSLEQVRAALTDQAYLDADSLESSLNLIRVLIWAAPILGFIGTVLGISFAIGDFSNFLGGQAGAGNLQMSQIQAGLVGVTSGLALAFNTTLVGLFVALFLMIPTSYVQKTEEDFLASVHETVANQVLAHLAPDLSAVTPVSIPLATSITLPPAEELQNTVQSLQEVGSQLNKVEETLRSYRETLASQATETATIVAKLKELEEARQSQQAQHTALLESLQNTLSTFKESQEKFAEALQSQTSLSSQINSAVQTMQQAVTQFGELFQKSEQSHQENIERLTKSIIEEQRTWSDQLLRREDLEHFGEKLSIAIKELAEKITPLTGTFDLRFIPRGGSTE